MESLALQLLDGLGMTGHFAAITGGDSFAMRKPDAGHIHGTIARAGGQPAGRSWSATASTTSSPPANAAIASIAVPFGYSDVPVTDLGQTGDQPFRRADAGAGCRTHGRRTKKLRPSHSRAELERTGSMADIDFID